MQICCDTHVHCYDFDALPSLLNSALSNFQEFSSMEKNVLFFTDGYVDRTWKKLQAVCDDGYRVGSWELLYSKNTQFIHAAKGECEILLAPGRQVNSLSGLEYLILGCDTEIEDKLDDEAILEQFNSTYTIVIPWGVGKWLGRRGRLLSQLISERRHQFLLGDNGGRPTIWHFVPQFKKSNSLKLNGSDPLPIDGELDRVASFGIKLELEENNLTLNKMLQLLKSQKHQNYGRSMNLFRFVKARFAMAMRK